MYMCVKLTDTLVHALGAGACSELGRSLDNAHVLGAVMAELGV